MRLLAQALRVVAHADDPRALRNVVILNKGVEKLKQIVHASRLAELGEAEGLGELGNMAVPVDKAGQKRVSRQIHLAARLAATQGAKLFTPAHGFYLVPAHQQGLGPGLGWVHGQQGSVGKQCARHLKHPPWQANCRYLKSGGRKQRRDTRMGISFAFYTHFPALFLGGWRPVADFPPAA